MSQDDEQPDKVEAAMRLLKGLTDVDLAEVLKQGLLLKESRDSRLRATGMRVINIGYERKYSNPDEIAAFKKFLEDVSKLRILKTS